MVAKSTLSVGLAACRHFTNRNNYYIKPTFLALFIQHKCSLQRIQTRFCSINPSNSENQQVCLMNENFVKKINYIFIVAT